MLGNSLNLHGGAPSTTWGHILSSGSTDHISKRIGSFNLNYNSATFCIMKFYLGLLLQLSNINLAFLSQFLWFRFQQKLSHSTYLTCLTDFGLTFHPRRRIISDSIAPIITGFRSFNMLFFDMFSFRLSPINAERSRYTRT